MTQEIVWTLVTVGVLMLGGLVYWQLVIAEGAYLGQRVVTWLYDLTAHRYDAIKQFDHEMEAAFLGRPLATALRDMPTPLVLDIATGTGRLPLTLFAQPSFRGRIIGLDDSRRILSIAAQKMHDQASRLDLLWYDAICLPFPDAAFDVVTCLEMLEFVPHPERQLAEAVRVLRPGGILVTTRRRGLHARLMPGKTHSPGAFADLLSQLGLTAVRLEPWQVDYDLAWGVCEGHTHVGVRSLLEILRCPYCGTAALREQNRALHCRHCGSTYPIRGGVIELCNRQLDVTRSGQGY